MSKSKTLSTLTDADQAGRRVADSAARDRAPSSPSCIQVSTPPQARARHYRKINCYTRVLISLIRRGLKRAWAVVGLRCVTGPAGYWPPGWACITAGCALACAHQGAPRLPLAGVRYRLGATRTLSTRIHPPILEHHSSSDWSRW